MDENRDVSFVGISVAVETESDGTQEIGLVIHTKDQDSSFVIALPPDKAIELGKNLVIAAHGVLTGQKVGDLIQ